MDKTAVSIRAGKPLVAAAARKEKPDGLRQVVTTVLAPLASLRLTVMLFALSVILVFAGTVAQVDLSNWTVVKQYFRSSHVWIPLQIFFPRNWEVGGGFPFPGGWLLGGLLLANLIAAHTVRFKISWKRSGILLIHTGLLVMLLSEVVAGKLQIEGNMSIDEGSSTNYVEISRATELAVVDSADPTADEVVAIPQSILRKGGVIRHEKLPFDIEVNRFMANSRLVRTENQKDRANPATAGAGLEAVAVEEGEVSGVSTKQNVEAPSAYVTLKSKSDGKPLNTYLVSLWLNPQPVAVDGKKVDLALRFKRNYKPYSLHLLEFRFDRYAGTEIAKNYSSKVILTDPEQGVSREVLISMNEPLRYRGETFFQADFDKRTEKSTVLQVVRNPGWLMPYASCVLVTLGMMVHFGLNLFGFLSRRAAV